MDFVVPSVLIGVISSIITELFKFIPWLAKTDTRKRITAFLITFLLVLGYSISNPEVGGKYDFLGILLLSLTVAYSIFKTILKEITSVLGLSKRFNEC